MRMSAPRSLQAEQRAVVGRPLDDDGVAVADELVEQERVGLHRAVGDEHLLDRRRRAARRSTRAAGRSRRTSRRRSSRPGRSRTRACALSRRPSTSTMSREGAPRAKEIVSPAMALEATTAGGGRRPAHVLDLHDRPPCAARRRRRGLGASMPSSARGALRGGGERGDEVVELVLERERLAEAPVDGLGGGDQPVAQLAHAADPRLGERVGAPPRGVRRTPPPPRLIALRLVHDGREAS